jgi:hypothetical protein
MPDRWNKEAGPKPSKDVMKQAHQLARPGTKTATAVAMALRPCGTTQAQIKAVLGKPYRNKLRELTSRGAARTVLMRQQDGLKVYRITLARTRRAA